MTSLAKIPRHCFFLFLLTLLASICVAPAALAQSASEVSGAISGQVFDPGNAQMQFKGTVTLTNEATKLSQTFRLSPNGRFSKDGLPPSTYILKIEVDGYEPVIRRYTVPIMRPREVIPRPFELVKTKAAAPTPKPTPTPPPVIPGTPPPVAVTTPTPAPPVNTPTPAPVDSGVADEINYANATRDGSFSSAPLGAKPDATVKNEVTTLPLGNVTLVRTFDEFAFLLPGVALPPLTIGNGQGPGQGPGVGSAGQFSVNGLRSRGNNFTVDGSDNNDEDIGVRRQGFFTLVPQPIESVQEYRVTTLLSPAQYGRNFGAQVNAVSKSGGSEHHGAAYGLFNSSQLNARNFFDTVGGNTVSPLTVGGRPVVSGICLNFSCQPVTGTGPVNVRLNNGNKDSFTLLQSGFVLGGPVVPKKLFYFFAAEGQVLNANQEASFAVPTIAQRGAFGSGATGILTDPVSGATVTSFPTSTGGDVVFSFFPFPNNPNGVYRGNTFTKVLPASAQGTILSGKVDNNFTINGRPQSIAGRYNFTDDRRDLPVTGGALFSSLRPDVRTQNLSLFLNSALSSPNADSPVSNELRLSYGRTRLKFDELPLDREFLLPTQRSFNNRDDGRFLLNTTLTGNYTLPGATNVPYNRFRPAGGSFRTTEDEIGPIGQLLVAGFSPVGVDVFNFPQRRVNNTYQLADTLSVGLGQHRLAFGADVRRAELNSDLPRNSRPLLNFNGAPQIGLTAGAPVFSGRYFRPEDFAAAGAPSGFFQALVLPGRGANINLRYYQFYFFGQDEWRVRPNLSLSYGLRYEYTTPAREVNRKIENTFNDPLLNSRLDNDPTEILLVAGLKDFIAGRTRLFDADRNNFAPRLGFAYSPDLFGADHTTVFRVGYGLFYDQILGAVVSQSRNVFPTFTTLNFGGGLRPLTGFNIFNPSAADITQPGTLNTLNLAPDFTFNDFLSLVYINFPSSGSGRPFGATLPSRKLSVPVAQQYSVSFEQQLSRNFVFSAAYIGTQGRHLLRLTTPNLGPNYLILPSVDLSSSVPVFFGRTYDPGAIVARNSQLAFSPTVGRPNQNIGPVNLIETTANSRYDALQVQLRGRTGPGSHPLLRALLSDDFQINYTFSKVEDDVSDFFDLAGASALPQNSLTRAGERGPANFDARHRIAYNSISTLPDLRNRHPFLRFLFGGLQITGTGFFQSGQPFTVNSIFDVNLDGNLTDRLNSTNGITRTGDRQRPLQLGSSTNLASLLASPGQDGSVGRNTFRAGYIIVGSTALSKRFGFKETQAVTVRVEVFNLFDTKNYGIPVRFLEAPGFGQATDTVTPGRRIQFALKYSF